MEDLNGPGALLDAADLDTLGTLLRELERGKRPGQLAPPLRTFAEQLAARIRLAREHRQRQRATTSRVTVAERAAADGVTPDAIRLRRHRGTLAGHHDPDDGELLVEPGNGRNDVLDALSDVDARSAHG